MNKQQLIKTLCTLGPVGYLPAPGTSASAVSLSLVLLLKYCCAPVCYAAITLLSIPLAIVLIKTIKHEFIEEDPSCIVIDELVGILVTFLLVPPTPPNLVIGFILFRFFDISKCWPVNKLEFPNATGIVLDDVVAGALSALILGLLPLSSYAQYLT